MTDVERPVLLAQLDAVEAQRDTAHAEAARLEAQAKMLRSGWSDKVWGAMYDAAVELEKEWEAGAISLVDALTVSDEIIAREYRNGKQYTCGAIATAATIEAMQPGQPVSGRGTGYVSGIVADPPRLVFSAHKKQKGIVNPTVLSTSIAIPMFKLNNTYEELEDVVTETTPWIRYVSDNFTVGQTAIQGLLDGAKFVVEWDDRLRFSNTSRLVQLLNMAGTFGHKGFEFDTEKLQAEIEKGHVSDDKQAKSLEVHRLLLNRSRNRRGLPAKE